ncbi:MAG: glycosyltransferase family 4 protein [Chthonomonadaceae bacterium]|nr:glycosyltransferase family 4 protein [Chthonomonadaceae bacterium]
MPTTHDPAKPRVLIPEGYPAPFCFALGQRNVELVRKPLIRGSRVLRALDAVTFVSGRGFDLVHTLNAVPLTARIPYVVTFESYLPRVPDDRYIAWLERVLLPRLHSDQCRALFGFSEFAMRQFRTQLARYPGSEALLKKAEVLYPVAPVRVQGPRPAPTDVLRLLLVGGDFMRKGGPALVRAHEELVRRGVPVETTVVSSLGWSKGDVAGPESRSVVDDEVARLRRSGIQYLPSLTNAQVLEAMAGAHFLALPSVNETFGFVCLEAMGFGVPVLATRTYALPEIVGDAGRLFDLPVDALGKWVGLAKRRTAQYDAMYLDLMDSLGGQMVGAVAELWEGRAAYPELSVAALRQMRSKFDPEQARDRLEATYTRALSRQRAGSEPARARTSADGPANRPAEDTECSRETA